MGDFDDTAMLDDSDYSTDRMLFLTGVERLKYFEIESFGAKPGLVKLMIEKIKTWFNW